MSMMFSLVFLADGNQFYSLRWT